MDDSERRLDGMGSLAHERDGFQLHTEQPGRAAVHCRGERGSGSPGRGNERGSSSVDETSSPPIAPTLRPEDVAPSRRYSDALGKPRRSTRRLMAHGECASKSGDRVRAWRVATHIASEATQQPTRADATARFPNTR